MPDKQIHIIAFNIPYPANYGGVIDVFYKLKALHKAGIKIHLHCYQYDRPVAPELNKYCESVNYYPRKTGFAAQFSRKPYIVESRQSDDLLKDLIDDGYPILFEGLHSCFYINHYALQGRLLIYRECNIEHDYYYNLYKSERKIVRKSFFLIESLKLQMYEKHLRYSNKMMVLSLTDRDYLAKKFPDKDIVYLPGFHGNTEVKSLEGRGEYALYHGNLSVSENALAAEYLIKEVFNDLTVPLKIAGLNPSESLKKLIAKTKNVELIPNPSQAEMEALIANAQINVLVTFQATGLKLKLLNTLYNGRWMLVNSKMLAGTGLESLCEIADEPAAMKQKLISLFNTEFDREQLLARVEILQKRFSDDVNAKKLIEEIWGK
ncbi:MAG: glycosyltransferase family 1 protein [Bacteroidales bacterium]|nr:glycosyltransferase family 1 protein [Bacteroidales bacterium]